MAAAEKRMEAVQCETCGHDVKITEAAARNVREFSPQEIGKCEECGAILIGGCSMAEIVDWAEMSFSGEDQKVVTIVEVPVEVYGRTLHIGFLE